MGGGENYTERALRTSNCSEESLKPSIIYMGPFFFLKPFKASPYTDNPNLNLTHDPDPRPNPNLDLCI